jgi:hypothetical protein
MVAMARSPSLTNVRIFLKQEIWSMPALVLESEANTIPSSSFSARQYVMLLLPRKTINYT